MNTKKLLLLLPLLYIFSACAEKNSDPNLVSVSILPQKYFIDQLTDEQLRVNVMVPPGSSHATYSPTPQQFQQLSASPLYMGIGHLGYETTWMSRLEELNADMQVMILSEHTKLIEGACAHDEHAEHDGHEDHEAPEAHHHGVDPHIWMSPKVMLELLPQIKTSLQANYPHLADSIENNYPQLLEKLNDAHKRMQALAASLDNRQFLIFHPALTYLARDYGLTQIAVEQDGKEPSPAYLARLIDQAREENIPVIFIQKEYDLRNAETISREAGIALVQIDPMRYDWTDSMNELMTQIEQHLKSTATQP
ncbi:metal ABC transporter solute-binding protein, Zn/Mn family [Geofilum rhodophaeum]|uniref:metal ABC transporter solute-binding protein, Zn/Mn family n=1 Tax=Geofilum rhodophaeum TaxID=1965019 RepID=UPI000B527DE4|nr:zinc ABC transporter substrate-binding protein [Geofilum rhodophaeum]